MAASADESGSEPPLLAIGLGTEGGTVNEIIYRNSDGDLYTDPFIATYFTRRRDPVEADLMPGPSPLVIERVLQAEIMRGGELFPIMVPLPAVGYPGEADTPAIVALPWELIDRFVAMIRRNYPDVILRVWDRRFRPLDSRGSEAKNV